jgi:hypothetical protein
MVKASTPCTQCRKDIVVEMRSPHDHVEQRKEAERYAAKSARTHYVEQLSGSMLIVSIKAGREMTPAACVAKANEMADALGMGIAECDKQ